MIYVILYIIVSIVVCSISRNLFVYKLFRFARFDFTSRFARFDSLSVRAVDEVVSLGVAESDVPLEEAGRHVSPNEFHELLLRATATPSAEAAPMEGRGADAPGNGVVLLSRRQLFAEGGADVTTGKGEAGRDAAAPPELRTLLRER